MSGPMNRRKFLRGVVELGAASAFVSSCGPLLAADKQERRAASIGILSGGFETEVIDAFRQGLGDHGWIEGKNINIHHRDVGSDLSRLEDEAAALIAVGVDLIVSTGPSSTTAILHTSPTTPVVMAGGGDPVTAGFVASLAEPGGTVTGVVSAGGLDPKRIELLKEVVPTAQRLGFITNLGIAGQSTRATLIESTAAQLGMQLAVFDVRVSSEIEPAFESARRWGADALYPGTNNPMANARDRVIALAASKRMPAIYSVVDWARAGGLISYGSNMRAVYRRAATHVDKILRGAKPSALPVELSTVFDLVVHRKALAALGLTIPATVHPLVTEWVDGA
jgi:putative ABC transport system substrate-binding protein